MTTDELRAALFALADRWEQDEERSWGPKAARALRRELMRL